MAYKIKVAHSPDSDDAFMFYAIANKKIDLGDYEFEIYSDEIQKLNQRALKKEDLDIFAVSFHAYAYLADKFQILKAGASMGGIDYGPRVVCAQKVLDKITTHSSNISSQEDTSNRTLFLDKNQNGAYLNKVNLKNLSIAIPGELTSAYLCLKLYDQEHAASLNSAQAYSPSFTPKFCAFDEVFDLVESGEVDAGLLIHESQLKIEEKNLVKLIDLGAWWHEYSNGLSMPLGCNVIKRSLGEDMVKDLSRILKQSIEFALDNFDDALDYARKFSKNGLDDKKAKRYIQMYVNESTVSLSDNDVKSIDLLFNKSCENKLLNISQVPVLDCI